MEEATMPTISIQCPDSVLISLKESPEEFAKEATKVLAVKLYEMGKLSSGRAAEFAGMSRISFLQILAEFGTPIFDLTGYIHSTFDVEC
jgi:predicted HTH domain antitoxin